MFYKITDPEFLGKYEWWSPADIESYHCTEDDCQEQVAYSFECPVDGLAGFYCQPHAVKLRLSKQAGT